MEKYCRERKYCRGKYCREKILQWREKNTTMGGKSNAVNTAGGKYCSWRKILLWKKYCNEYCREKKNTAVKKYCREKILQWKTNTSQKNKYCREKQNTAGRNTAVAGKMLLWEKILQ